MPLAIQIPGATLATRQRAIVAIAHKILKTVYLLIRRQTHYRDSAVNFAAMSVTRNAPRWSKMLTKHGFIPAAAQPFTPVTVHTPSCFLRLLEGKLRIRGPRVPWRGRRE